MRKSISLCVLCAMLLLAACSREGFYEAAGKTPAQRRDDPSQSAPVEQDGSEGFVTINADLESDNAEINFCVPDTQADGSAAAASIDAAIRQMAQTLYESAPEGGRISVYDGVCDNNARAFSTEYEVILRTADGEKTTKGFGMIFSSVTGDAMPVTELVSADRLAQQMLDADHSDIDADSDEDDSAKRAYLASLGSDALETLLRDAAGGFPGEIPACSCTVENGTVTVMLNTDSLGLITVRCPGAAA